MLVNDAREEFPDTVAILSPWPLKYVEIPSYVITTSFARTHILVIETHIDLSVQTHKQSAFMSWVFSSFLSFSHVGKEIEKTEDDTPNKNVSKFPSSSLDWLENST